MKKVVFTTLAILFATGLIFAQKQGTIIYEHIINIHKSLSAEQQALKAMIPETSTQKFQFIYNEKYGCFKNIPAEMPKGMSILMGSGSSKIWFNFEKDVFRKYIALDDELFHIETPMKLAETKPTGKSKTILNYTCKEHKSNDGAFSFWVTKDLPKNITPMPSLFFEGAVLAVDNDKMSFKAVSFSKDIDNKELIPVKSQKITHEQFQDLREEKMSEMKTMGGKVMKMGN
ncbi:hypothetical protein [Marinifilum sp.]|uniref:hypothetical protein n=1 Tax=Marinifilum sp. TaxID=2033137 RepID=UPI003BAA58C7